MINRSNTVYVDKYKYEDANELLGEIFKRVSIFCKYNGQAPSNIMMSSKQYFDIRKFNPNVISKKGDDYYILCAKIII